MIITRILTRLSQWKNHNVDYESLVPYVPFCPGIPKQIMQTCRKESELPERILQNISEIRSTNPEWKYLLYEDSMIVDYIKSCYGEGVLSYYNRISPEYGAAKADLFRYLFIYHEGGVYLDIKSSVTRSLSGSIAPDDSFLFSFWDNLEGEQHQGVGHYSDVFNAYPRGEIPQWFIISSKGHPVLRDIIIRVLKNIDEYNPYINGVGWTGTVFTTGPVPYSLTLYENINRYPHRSVNAFSELGFVYSVYEHEQTDATFHAKEIKSDYRKGRSPLIRHRNPIIELINVSYLRMIGRYGNRKGRKNQN